MRVSQKRSINSNADYIIENISNGHLTLRCKYSKPGDLTATRTLTLKSCDKLLRRPWCKTGHAVQGQTLGDTLYIHDINLSFITARWFRTAITRCSTLNITLVHHKDPLRLHPSFVQKRIYSHKAADEKAVRIYEDVDYVDVAWSYSKIKEQGYNCSCGEPLDQDWSIDRIDNARAHIKENCQITCRRCQHASGSR